LINPVDFDRKRLFEVLERRTHEDFSAGKGSAAAQSTGAKRTMNRDLTYILNGQLPRGHGEMPSMMGNYEMICPSAESDSFLK
jgi:hypothetical protein